MASKTLFGRVVGALVPQADAVNEAGGRAYAFTPRHALAQYAATGCLSGTYYASATDQLAKVLELASAVPTEFVAKTAVFARESGQMKDMPALLCAVLAVRDGGLLARVFGRVIDNGKMLRNFVQILRSGQVGRRSLGSLPKRLVRTWLESRSDDTVFRASVGNDPSLADVIRMVHPKPSSPSRQALYGWLLDREHNVEELPALVRKFEDFKAGRTSEVPDVPFQMLTSLPLDTAAWTAIARNGSWQMVRQNLNTFARHGVFGQWGVAERIAALLADPSEIERARAFPYQLLMAARSVDAGVPDAVKAALEAAMEVAVSNVPALPGKVVVCPDVSGSMSSPVTGHRAGATTAVRCIDVAALVAAAVLRKNPTAEVLPFESDVVATDRLSLRATDSVMVNANKLAGIGGGGTNCSAPLAALNARGARADLVIFVSDNESWMDAARGRGTATMEQWERFRQRNPSARMVCIDIQPYSTTQAAERADIFNVGGFSDVVFDLLAEFAAGRLVPEHWVGVIDNVKL